MKKRNNSGQEAMEFVLISSLVFIVALGTILIFGNKLASFFTGGGSAIANTAGSTAPTINSSEETQYKAEYNTELAYETANVGGQELTVKEDGTVLFNVNGQTLNLNPAAMNYINTTLQTSGASGAEDVIKAITKIISEEKAKYPDSNVPVEMAFGKSERVMKNNEGYKDASYSGTAEVNTASVKVGNRVIIISKDQGCKGSCSYSGTYILDGNYDPSTSKFTANVTSQDAASSPSGKLEANLDMSKGLLFKNAKYTQTSTSNDMVYDWNMNFSDTEKQYDI